MNLSEGLSDGLDGQILAGNERSPHRHEPPEQQCYCGHYLCALSLGIRIWAGRWPLCEHGFGSEKRGRLDHLFAYGKRYRNTSVDRNCIDRLMEITGGLKVSAHVPAAASKRQNAIIRRGSRRDMVAPVWEGVTLIPDEVTKAASGQIQITAILLHSVKILRQDGFHKQQIQIP